MSNFKIRKDGFGNSEGCNYGCCCFCKYSKNKSGEWIACNERCWYTESNVIFKSCSECDHREDYKKKLFYED